ncbi:uncharacterized protein MEPE_06730 [Melanopsichium pennsylvanicum]|uniref:Mediator of RNA polymerase II transcription subunit 13 n=2 Tax=Melanopsichium pennsylvanicum TaxID=63383 RepID=A0AAJ5C8V4_9BASI|nr:uncharacterized protein MEPE_06730 [Melanopsichium pennsylvanicum]
MVHNPGSFASHTRSSHNLNSPSAHRRVGSTLSSQHPSSSAAQTFTRPFANTAFPGTVSAPRSAVPPSSVSAPHKPIQHLPLLTNRTPTSFVKLGFRAQTVISWHRFSRNNAAAKETGQDPSPSTATTSAVASTFEELCREWDSGVQDAIASINKDRSRKQVPSHRPERVGLNVLMQTPLVYACSTRTLNRSSDQDSSDDLWLFCADFSTNDLAHEQASSTRDSEPRATTSAQSTGTGQATRAENTSDEATQQLAGDSQAKPTQSRSLHQLPHDLATAISRITPLATFTSGSYTLASTASGSIKGKQSALSTDDWRAHKYFKKSTKARMLDSMLRACPASQQHDSSKVHTRARLRFGEHIVFMPRRQNPSCVSMASSDAAWLSAPGNSMTSADGAEQSCFITELDVSLCSTAIVVRATSQKLAALPLADTRHLNTQPSSASPSSRATILLAPLRRQAELVGVIPASCVGEEYLAELRSTFATLTHGATDVAFSNDALFASGLAICSLPASDAASTEKQPRPQSQQPKDAVMEVFAEESAGESARDQAMHLSATPPWQCERPESQQPRSDLRQFVWPVCWSLVVPTRSEALFRGHIFGYPAWKDLQNVRSQPMTPIKELVSFTLRTLNDANESALAQSAAPYTPGEPDDASIPRHRVDRLPPTRPGTTPASITYPDFEFAVPAAGSATPSHSLPAAAHSVSGASPAKRELTSAEQVHGGNSTEAFGDELNWMQFLPQANETAAPVAAPATQSSPARQVSSAGLSTSQSLVRPSVAVSAAGDAKDAGRSWQLPAGNASAPPEMRGVTAPPTSHSLLLPHRHLQSHDPTPFQANETTTPLGFTQHSQAKRKAGESDIFGNLGLLTDDDFDFFDASTFGLEPENALQEPSASLQHLFNRRTSASSNNNGFAQPLGPPNMATSAVSQPAMPATAAIEDVAMGDIEQNSLDVLFSSIPGLQDVMITSEPSQAQDTPVPLSLASSTVPMQAAPARSGHGDAAAVAPISAHPFHSALASFTPRDVSAATPFGDPASLPAFTPSSLTESSPAFGNPNHKTPRTPYSPVEDYRDGATIVEFHTADGMEDSVQAYRERDAAMASDATGHAIPGPGPKADAYVKEDRLRLADASSATSAAANAAMDADISSRKRPAIVPNAFLPLARGEVRKPLQRLAAGARTNLGRKYDPLGKFSSKPKNSTAVTTVNSMVHAIEQRADKARAPEQGRLGRAPLATHLGLGAARQIPSRRGQALLNLRSNRNHTKASPGALLSNNRRASGQRMVDGPVTPRSSDDIAVPCALSASDSDTSSSGEDDSDDALSDTEGAVVKMSNEAQAGMKGLSKDIVTSYVRGAWNGESSIAAGTVSEDAMLLMQSISIPSTQRNTVPWSAKASPRPIIRRWMLTRTAEWLAQNPQFRAIYSSSSSSAPQLHISVGEKVEVLETMYSGLNLAYSTLPKPSTDNSSEASVRLPTLQGLVKTMAHPAAGVVEVAEVLEPPNVSIGCQGSVVSTLPSALALWDKSKLSAVSGPKHIVAKVLLTHASPAWHSEIVSWLDRLRIAFESYGLGTHTGGPQSILAVADGSESLALSSYLDRLFRDGETWLDTLRSISSRVQLDLLQGKHVVVYTLQPSNSPSCRATGFHGLLRLERDLRAMLAEQVGVLAEQLVVRVVDPSLVTEGGSLGFAGMGMGGVRRWCLGVYESCDRLVRRQPTKVLHGKEVGPISAIVQFPAFSLSTNSDGKNQGKVSATKFSLSWPMEASTAIDQDVLLHVSYRICDAGVSDAPQVPSGGDVFDGNSHTVGLGNFEHMSPAASEKLVLVSAIDDRAQATSVNVLRPKGNNSIEMCVETVFRWAVVQASRARLRWRLTISCAGVVSQRELEAWRRVVEAYLGGVGEGEMVIGEVALMCVRQDESGAVCVEKGAKVKANAEWARVNGENKANAGVLLDSSDFSQIFKFCSPLPLSWTLAFGHADQDETGQDGLAMPMASSILVHQPKKDVISNSKSAVQGSHVLAVDLLAMFGRPQTSTQADGNAKQEDPRQEAKREQEVLDTILKSLHRLRLISEERSQLGDRYSADPWGVAVVNMLSDSFQDVILVD